MTHLNSTSKPWDNGLLKVSENHRFLKHENGVPFFWLGDTAWLMFSRLTKEEVETYLEDRRQKGYNVIQVTGIHKNPSINVYNQNALIEDDMARPNTDSSEYGFWNHVDYIVDKAAEKGMYIAIVPTWGSNVASGLLNTSNADIYGKWIGNRYKDKPNIFWMIGGDVRGGDNPDVWNMLAKSIKEVDKNHLMTYHPFGRTQSSTWFHQETWLDFNMFQSGHRRYDQFDGTADWKGEDGWRYIEEDYTKTPPKPTIDGEPSYEGIPQGLHDPKEPLWTAADCRRYAYWPVFAGAFGHTYGHSAVMQFHNPNFKDSAYGNKKYWYDALNDDGAVQMQYLKQLMLAVPFTEGTPDQSIINGDIGEKYDHLRAIRGADYLFVYTYTGRTFSINLGKISGQQVNTWWYNPRNGAYSFISNYKNTGVQEFTPSGEKCDGNDWVLVIADSNTTYFKA